MPRQLRIHYPGAVFHVIARGNNKNDVFLDEEDFKKYLYILLDCLACMPFQILAFALIPNHIHLLVEVGHVPLWKLMKLVHQRYTQYFHRKYGTCGHVFQGRYKAKLVQTESYFVQLLYYIHNNPVKAGIANKPEEYRWTGHNEILQKKPFIINTVHVLKYLDDDINSAYHKYASYIPETNVDEIPDGTYQSIDKLQEDKIPDKIISQDTLTIDRLLTLVATEFNVPRDVIIGMSKNREHVAARRTFIYFARQIGKTPGNNLAEMLGTSPSYISKVYQRVLFNKYPELNAKIKIIKLLLGES